MSKPCKISFIIIFFCVSRTKFFSKSDKYINVNIYLNIFEYPNVRCTLRNTSFRVPNQHSLWMILILCIIINYKGNILDFTLMHRNQCINLCQESVSWTKYPYVASECAQKSWNASQLAPAPVFWRVEIQTATKSRLFVTQYFFFLKFNHLSLFVLETSGWS